MGDPTALSPPRRRGVLADLGLLLSSAAMVAFALPGAALVVPDPSALPWLAGLNGPLGALGLAPGRAFGVPLAAAPAVALGSALLDGFGVGVFGIIRATVLQELIPADTLGRVSSVDWLGSLALQPLGLALAGVLTDGIGARWVFLAGGALNLALALVALSIRGIRRLQ